MALRAVIFDYGHTLIDFTPAEDALLPVYEQIREILTARVHAEIPQAPDLIEAIARRVERMVDESYARRDLQELDIVSLFEQALGTANIELPREMIQQIAEMEHRATNSALTPNPGSAAALAELHGLGLKIGVVSNAHFIPRLMREDLERFGLARYVDDAVFSSEIGVRKPHPAIFRKVLSELDVQPEDALFVGDRLRDDISGAKALGMLGVLTRQFRQEDLDESVAVPDFVVSDVSQIPPYVREILAQ
ncbi:MAG: HAD family hydrolase [Chloroflexota bacterium]